MRAVIFAAGLGTRLYPFTKDKPKALVEVKGRTMLGHTFQKMKAAGIKEVVVNVHAFADKVESYIHEFSMANPEMQIQVSDERALLLETGGGLKKMQSMLEEDAFIVHNVDVLSTIDLNALEAADLHFSVENPLHLATLAVQNIESDRYLLFNESGLLCGWENVKTGGQRVTRPSGDNVKRYGFTGIHLIHPEIFPLMTEHGVFSIMDAYLRLSRDYEIRMFDVSDAEWFDIGSPEQLKLAEEKASWI